MINKKELNTLLNRYMEGETTLKEEQQLVTYFKSHPNVSVSLQPIRQLILGLEAIRKPLQQEEISTKQQKHNRKGFIIRRIVSVAASLLLITLLTISFYHSQNYCKAIVYGHPVNDREQIMREVNGTIGEINDQTTIEHQLHDVLLSTE